MILITFTGSVGVGKYIAEHAGYKRTVLELGGNDPLIVCNDLDDDDLKKAVELSSNRSNKKFRSTMYSSKKNFMSK